jgi:Anti-sigma-K factor rskA
LRTLRNGRNRRRVAGLPVAGAAIVGAAIAGCGGSAHSTRAASPQTTAAVTTPHASTSPRTSRTTTTPGTLPPISLVSPGGGTTTSAIAEVVKQGKESAIAIVGHGLPANTKHNAYAVWLYNTPNDAVRLGFVNPGVGKNGRLATTGPLPPNAAHFKRLVITIETTANPTRPGAVILRGNLTGV